MDKLCLQREQDTNGLEINFDKLAFFVFLPGVSIMKSALNMNLCQSCLAAITIA